LFPYGRGGPSDRKSKSKNSDFAEYAQDSLMYGNISDGRRMQQEPLYIFVAHHRESRKKLGGVAFRASIPGQVIICNNHLLFLYVKQTFCVKKPINMICQKTII
jgi:hypothetical protein